MSWLIFYLIFSTVFSHDQTCTYKQSYKGGWICYKWICINHARLKSGYPKYKHGEKNISLNDDDIIERNDEESIYMNSLCLTKLNHDSLTLNRDKNTPTN